MKPTKTLIRALRETAHKLRNGADYDWMRMHECNCGLLAQTIMGIDADDLWDRLVEGDTVGAWANMAQRIQCDATGLEREDYQRIENLEGDGRKKDPHAVAAWMDAQADELERRRVAKRSAP